MDERDSARSHSRCQENAQNKTDRLTNIGCSRSELFCADKFLRRCGRVTCKGFPQAPNLRRMIMSVRCIDRQPMLGSVGATFGVRAFTPPVFVTHEIEQLRGSCASATKRIQSGSDVPEIVIQARGERVLIVALDQRMVFYQQSAKPEGAGCFAIGEVVNDFGSAPFAFKGMRCQRLLRKIFQASDNFLVTLFISGDHFWSLFRSHFLFSLLVYYSSGTNALESLPGGPLFVLFTRKLLRSIASRQAVCSVFRPGSDVARLENRKHTVPFFFSLPNPGVNVLILRGSGLFLA